MDILDQFDKISRPVVEQVSWMVEVEMHLGTVEMLDKIEKECLEAGRIGLDLETTGLDQRAFPGDSGKLATNDKIVGYCIAPTTSLGYYVPVRHRDKGADANVPVRLVAAMLNRLHAAGVVFVFHNSKFDQKFLKYESAGEVGDWEVLKSWEDTLILAYLRNPRERQKGLKYLSKLELGREMIELKQLFPPDQVKAKNFDFATLDPRWEPVVWYAAADAINTLALYEILAPTVLVRDKHGNSQVTVYQIEKICMRATAWMEQCRIHVDRPKLAELIVLGQKEWWACLQGVYAAVGEALQRDVKPSWVKNMEPYDYKVLSPDYMQVRATAMANSRADIRPPLKKSVPKLTDPKVLETVGFPHSYDITIPAQFGLMLRELGVEGLEATEKSGQVKTSKDVMEKVIEMAGEKHLWMNKVRRFREVAKALGNVLFNIYLDTSPERSPDGCVWANFNGTKVDTGRFSTPTPSKKHFFGQVNWNVQSTKAYYFDPKNPPPDCVYRQREVISARPNHILFAIDYSGVELRIVTNLSGEPKWLAEFFRCSSCTHAFPKGALPPPFCPKCGSDKIGDLHSLTTVGVYGESIKENPKMFKLKRQIGKIVNFLLCYGGSGNAVMRSTGVDKEEGWRIKNKFDKTYKGLLKWWGSQETVAKKQLYVTTAFGRKYPVPDIVSEIGMWRSKAKRNAVNGPVQGTSADIMKLAMGLLYREFIKRGWIDRGPGLEDLVKMTISIHDELVFEIHESVVKVAIPVIEHIMCVETVKNLGWVVPLKVDIEFGQNWTVPNNLTEMTWNQGGGDWTPHLISLFPDRYENYLKCGGKPTVEGDGGGTPPTGGAPTPPATDVTPRESPPAPSTVESAAPVSAAPVAAAPTAEIVMEREGNVFLYKMPRHRMTPDNAKKLAQVISRCHGRGLDILRVTDDSGNDLLDGTVKVAYEEFRVLARYEGLG